MKRPSTVPTSIVLVRLSALGDATLLVPVVRTLQTVWPQTQLTWVIGSGAYELLSGLSGVEFLVFDKRRGLGGYQALRQQLRGRRFDVLLALQASLRANLIYPLIRAPLKLGFDRARARDAQQLFTNAQIPSAREHLLDSFFAFANYLGVSERVMRWDLPIAPADFEWARAQLPSRDFGPRLAVNPCASKRERDWPVERCLAVLRAARERWHAQIVLTGGPGDYERAVGAKLAQSIPGVTNLIGCTQPKQLAAVLRSVDCLLAPDTGPVHMAVAMNTPVVGLYAVAPSALSGPYGGGDLVIDKFAEAVRTILQRDPATVPWRTRVHHGDAMALIEPSEVLEKLARVFAR